jgi:hypothetical protein
VSAEVNAKPDDMVRIFAQLQPPQYDGNVTRDAPANACANGLKTCAAMQGADKFATDKLQKFLTHMAQGVAAYVQMVRDAAQTYQEASDAASKALTDKVSAQLGGAAAYNPELKLPDLAAGFENKPVDGEPA